MGKAVEAVIDGQRTFAETQDLVRDALRSRCRSERGGAYCYVMIVDMSGAQVVYTADLDGGDDDLWQCTYTVDAAGLVELGEPTPVQRTYAPAAHRMPDDDPGEPAAVVAESVVRETSRVIEARGTDPDGGRVFRVKIIAYGDSKNGRRYKPAVMREAAPLYEGARAYDHHRTVEELRSSTLTGLVGSYRSVEALDDGLYADLHLLPSAVHAAEALDRTIEAQAAGLPALVGLSHDVLAHFTAVTGGGGRRLQEATKIVDVQSVDVVANPSAGGGAVRVVAGGVDEEEQDVPPTKADVLAALKEATGDELAAVGLARAATTTTMTTAQEAVRAVEASPAAVDDTLDKSSFLGRLLIREKLEGANLTAAAEAVIAALPQRITEADVDAQIASIQAVLPAIERAGLRPTVTQVTREARDTQVQRLDAMFDRFGRPQDASVSYTGPAPYRSLKEAFIDFTGYRGHDPLGADFNRLLLRESLAPDYEYTSQRAVESMSSTSWAVALGDSVTRQMVAEYQRPALLDWMRIVSAMPPVNDFRAQRRVRVGGYGVLPTVAQGAPYQPLTSPGNEEVTYTLAKRGGTEDVTLEMIANDDVQAIARIPFKLALAAKRTIFDFVFELIRPGGAAGPLGTSSNPTIYDAVTLYHATHSNTAASALSQTALSATRTAMRKQAAYGDSQDILSVVPSLLIVPPTLEELAFQLCSSAVAVPATPAGPSDIPNIHSRMDYVVVDYWDALSTTGWAVVADPSQMPTIEVGFYQGRREPELFQQSDQTVGSMFNSDKFTWKLRHIYSGAVLDWRGFQRGNS